MPKRKKKSNKFKKYIKMIKKSKSKFNLSETLTIMVVSILVGILIGSSMTYGGDSITISRIPEDLEELIATYNDISLNYYDKIDNKELINSAIKGMVDSLDDPYSQYMENETSETFNETVDGEYSGIGATVSYDGKNIIIEAMYNNSPSKKAGLAVGDKIIEVDGKKTEKLTLSQTSKLIKGKDGTIVTIKVLRGDEEKTYKVKRSKISIPSVISKVIEKNNKKIGYISIDIFASNTDKQFEKQLKSLEKKKIDSLIIDVRSNPGGHLLQVTNMIELFTKKNSVIYQIEKKGKTKKIKDKTKEHRNYDIVVLINHSSASASEVFSSTLKDVYKAKLVGKTTYGKGTVQSSYQLENGSTLKYTTQKWLTSKGKWINEKGVTPDYDVDLDDKYYEKPSEENDNQLQKAVEILSKKEEEKSKYDMNPVSWT